MMRQCTFQDCSKLATHVMVTRYDSPNPSEIHSSICSDHYDEVSNVGVISNTSFKRIPLENEVLTVS